MKTETSFEEITEKWGSGCVTAMKSGSTFHLTLPKAIEKELGIENRDRIFIKICKAGDKKSYNDKRFKKSMANFRAKETIEDLKEDERNFIKTYIEYRDISSQERLNEMLEMANKELGKDRVDELIRKFGSKKEVSNLPTMLDAEKPELETEGVEENERTGIRQIAGEEETEVSKPETEPITD